MNSPTPLDRPGQTTGPRRRPALLERLTRSASGRRVAAALATGCVWSATAAPFVCRMQPDRVIITRNDQPVVTYVFRDDTIRRPFFANLHAPGGLRVTRPHPPRPGLDPDDHATMHPGVWLAFGDLDGHDFWRNHATVRHLRFTAPPRVGDDGTLRFATLNRYEAEDGTLICEQTSKVSLRDLAEGRLLIWQATFRSEDRAFYFGDQEEMGMGVRVATPIIEKNGGLIRNSDGKTGAQATWGQPAAWCDYAGRLDDHWAGVIILPDPDNFRRSWWHNRNYGLMVANPFGRQAMHQGEPSRVRVPKGQPFTLRFGVLLHASASAERLDLNAAWQRFLAIAKAP